MDFDRVVLNSSEALVEFIKPGGAIQPAVDLIQVHPGIGGGQPFSGEDLIIAPASDSGLPDYPASGISEDDIAVKPGEILQLRFSFRLRGMCDSSRRLLRTRITVSLCPLLINSLINMSNYPLEIKKSNRSTEKPIRQRFAYDSRIKYLFVQDCHRNKPLNGLSVNESKFFR